MRETGTVVEMAGHVARVQVEQGPHCGSCCACSALSGGSAELDVPTDTTLEVGSRVVVEIPEQSSWVSSLLLFCLPLVGLVAGVVVGQEWQPFGWSSNAAALTLGFGLLVVLFAVSAAIDRAFVRKRQPQPSIVQVLSPDNRDPAE